MAMLEDTQMAPSDEYVDEELESTATIREEEMEGKSSDGALDPPMKNAVDDGGSDENANNDQEMASEHVNDGAGDTGHTKEGLEGDQDEEMLDVD